jgi:hypothetical protein
MENVGIFYGNLVYFNGIWYSFPVLVCFVKKNLASACSEDNNIFHYFEKRTSQLGITLALVL